MPPSEVYSVQRCVDPDTLTFDAGKTVSACTALDAASREFGERVSVVGKPSDLIGRVLSMGDDYRPVVLMVYRPKGLWVRQAVDAKPV